MKKLLCYLLVATMAFGLSYCTKSGPEGPQGEQGPRGADGTNGKDGARGAAGAKGAKGDKGDKGAKGDKGDKGDMGNANVHSTGWKTIEAANWDQGYGSGATTFYQPGDKGAFYSSSGLGFLSEAEAKGGLVLVYARLPSDPNSARLLPFRFSYSSAGFAGTVELRFAYGTTPNTAHWVQPGAVLLDGTWNTSTPIIRLNYLPNVSFCMVTIPASNIARQSAPPVDYSDYEAVKAYYHLSD